ncbi:AGE family epimerase/isomerase [Roseateles asaccharophilus]|uniref:Mannose/cellobiose epimerase-like protein (N-acyl-D-glucosamine 2-epimerase family) n=1 Tax=Roseateles asaccharophilus TaxID=582607 RepID=A0ABU2ABE7_9BURK|nr:mannose/cellobiose epimerase-like protein (N-acyl-D-glucosamine 2-epimerase family) [Roseateles asaccharophilus]
MNFWDPDFLRAHVRHTLAFYAPVAVDASGGFFHFFKDNGTVYDRRQRHLVSSARFVFNHAMAFRAFGDAEDRRRAAHGLAYLRDVHRQPDGGYAWLLDHDTREVLDTTNHCYGLAFVLLAHAHAAMAGVAGAREGIAETCELMEQRFWEPDHGLYADEADAGWRLSNYRGQNANMHSCEALLAAHEATGDERYLDRAMLVAENICVRQAARCGGSIWEHYDTQWQPDWDYNRDDPANLFRPWSYQVGHLTEWAKLLVMLHRVRPEAWLLPRAFELFDEAWAKGWDATHGGLVYGFDRDGRVCDADKYFWVQAESFAAAALLQLATGEKRFADAYDKLWAYSWAHFVDHEHGAWFRILSPDNQKLSDEKSPAGKTDYHTMGACHEVLLGLKLAGRG